MSVISSDSITETGTLSAVFLCLSPLMKYAGSGGLRFIESSVLIQIPELEVTSMPNLETFVQRAVEQGALAAKVIESGSIVTAPWVRLKCQFGCGRYGKSHCCPPKTPTPSEMQSVIDCYTRGLLIHCRGKANPTKIVVKLEKEIFLSGFYKALGFGAGPCRLCKECGEDGCLHSELARPAMEACGIDVYATAHNNGYPIEVLKDKSCEGNYFGLVLIE
jgi:predicted metal-binding protein